MVDRSRLDAALSDLPLFPLGQVMLFPGATLQLHVFEPRYRALLKDVVETHGVLAIVHVPDAKDVDAEGRPRLAKVAGAGIVTEHDTLPDGRSNIRVRGVARVFLEELPFVPPYRRARARFLEERPGELPPSDHVALLAAASSFAAEVRKRDTGFSFELPSGLPPAAAADLCAHHLVVDAAARQAILEQLDVAERVQLVLKELASQQRALTLAAGGALN